MSQKYVYLMLLEGDNYYIGSTKYPENIGSLIVTAKWMKIHKPVLLLNTWLDFSDSTVSLKTILTLKYMREYGIDKVRGGGYSEVELDEVSRNNINHFLRNMENLESIPDLVKSYKKVKDTQNRIYRSMEYLNLDYRQMTSKFEEFENNEDFHTLDFNDKLTRSKKRKIFGDIKFHFNENKKLKA